MTEAYPLAWPMARPRTQAGRRREASFGKKSADTYGGFAYKKSLTIADALRRLQDEIDRIGARDFVLSSNLRRNLDGSPKSGQAEPEDPGVVLYFTLKGKPICMPCDTYRRAADNIAAIAKHIEATRAIERYGVASIAEMFSGFTALPAPKSPWEILGVPPGSDADTIRGAHRRKATTVHPDTGGSTAAMAELNAARDQALRELMS